MWSVHLVMWGMSRDMFESVFRYFHVAYDSSKEMNKTDNADDNGDNNNDNDADNADYDEEMKMTMLVCNVRAWC